MIEKLMAYEKKFLNLYTKIILVMFAYMVYTLMVRTLSVSLVVCFVLVVLININTWILLKKVSLIHKTFFLSLKQIYLVIYAYYIFQSVEFIQVMALLFYIITLFEIITLYELYGKNNKKIITLVMIIPIILGIGISFVMNGFSFSDSLYMILLSVAMVGLLDILLFYIVENTKVISRLQKKVDEEIAEKETLKLGKIKYKQLHSVVLKQKNEIERKNIVLHRVSAEMYTQAELLRYISSVLDIYELMGLVTDSIIGAIGVDTCMLVIYDNGSSENHFKVNSSLQKDYSNQFQIDIQDGLYESYFMLGQPFMDSNVDSNKYPFIKDRVVGSLIIVPLIKSESVYGLLIAEHRTKYMFDDYSVNFFKNITNQINIAVNNANIYKEMKEMAIKDGLTGLYNRRQLQKMVGDVISELKGDDVVSLALFDIDKFKRVNDTYGHLFGDVAIKAIAKIANEYSTKYNGIAGRYGGEEFVIAIPGKTIEEAEAIIKLFHADIKNIRLIYNETEEVRINVSIGLSTCPLLAKDTESLLRRADNAMYYAKQHGRGKLIVDHEGFGNTISNEII